MKEKNLVSIVISNHNRKDMILRLPHGLLQNDYKKIEIIIVNDALKYGTSEVIK